MGFMESFSDFWFGPGRTMTQDIAQQGKQYAYMGASPYDDRQKALIGQLQQQFSGQGPSLAAQQYAAMSQNGMNQNLAMSRGRGAGAARNAGRANAAMQQGFAGASAMARTNEQMQTGGLLQGALSAASQQDYQRALANQQMYQQAMGNLVQQGGIGQSLAGLAAQGVAAYATGGASLAAQGAQGGGSPGGMIPQQYRRSAPVTSPYQDY